MIFDRWGEKIFESKDITQPWDGKYKGKLVLCVAHQVNTGVFDKVIKI